MDGHYPDANNLRVGLEDDIFQDSVTNTTFIIYIRVVKSSCTFLLCFYIIFLKFVSLFYLI